MIRADTIARAGTYKGLLSRYLRQQSVPAQRLLDEALALIPAVAAEARGNPDEARAVYHLSRLLVDTLSRLPDREPPPLLLAWEKVNASLHSDQVNRVDRLLLDATICIGLACQARGKQNLAIDVTADGWADFDINLSRAEDALHEAWDLDPTAIEIPRLMLCVETGLGRDRERVDSWFRRAMLLNGDDYFACLAMMDYLAPYWYGSEGEMLSFGRACLKTRNWEGRLPFILLVAHSQLEEPPFDTNARKQYKPGYFARPYVWADMKAIFEPYLARYPDKHVEKSDYAWFAALAGDYVLADRIFKELGNDWNPRPPDKEYYVLRDKAASEAAKQRKR